MNTAQPNWKTAPEWANWWAVNIDGKAHYYAIKPLFTTDGFWTRAPFWASSYCLDQELKEPFENWKESLTERPQKISEKQLNVKRMSEIVKYENDQLVVEWPSIPEEFMYVTADESGETWMFIEQPVFIEDIPGYWDMVPDEAKRKTFSEKLWARPLGTLPNNVPNAKYAIIKRPE